MNQVDENVDHTNEEINISGGQGQTKIKGYVAIKRHFLESKFRRELKVLKDLNKNGGNKHVVQLLKANIRREIHMPHSGTDLFFVLTEYGKPFDNFILRNVFGQILDGLLFMKEVHKYSHFDLKLENILLKRNGTVVLCDFSAAKTHKEIMTKLDGKDIPGVLLKEGTSMYMCPELLLDIGIPFGEKADIWSLGVLFFQCAFKYTIFTQIDLYGKKNKTYLYQNFVRTDYTMSRIETNTDESWNQIFKRASDKPLTKNMKEMLRSMLSFISFYRYGLRAVAQCDYMSKPRRTNRAIAKELFL